MSELYGFKKNLEKVQVRSKSESAAKSHIVPTLISNTPLAAPATRYDFADRTIPELANWNVVVLYCKCGNANQNIVCFRGVNTQNYMIDALTSTVTRGGYYVDWANNRIRVRWVDGRQDLVQSFVQILAVYGLVQNVDVVDQDTEDEPSDEGENIDITDLTEEVLGIRIGADGTIYETAGEAVRQQYEALAERLDAISFEDVMQQINDAIAAIPTEVETWLDDHPEATTTVQDGAITEAKLSSGLKFLTAINLNGLTYSTNIVLPVAKSYVEAVTYLAPYYYAVCRDYTNTPNTGYVAIYDADYTLVNYVYTNSVYGIANNIFNDGTRIYVDFDSGYHVSFNTSVSDDRAVLNASIRNIAFWNNKFYGITINANDVTVSVLESDLTTVVSTFSIATARQTLQSASIIDGILMIPTTKGLFKFIDVINQVIIAEVPYYDSKEIENFFEDADGSIKCCGHFYGLNGIFNIGSFNNGTNEAKMQYHSVDGSLGDYRIFQNNDRYGFYEITNGKSMSLPVDTGDLLIFKNARLMISNTDNAIYAYNGSWRLIGLTYPITKSATVNTNTVYFQLTNYGHLMVRCETVIVASATTSVDIDLSEIYEKLGLGDARNFTFYVTGITAGKNIIHADTELYMAQVVVEKTKITFYVRNITQNSTSDINAKFAFYKQII